MAEPAATSELTPPAARPACLVCGTAAHGEPCAECGWLPPDLSLPSSEQIDYPDEAHAALAAIEGRSYWFRHRNRLLLGLLRKFPPGGTLWDIGGGNGFQAREFQDNGYPVVLSEPSRAGCRQALERGVRYVFPATLGELQLPDARLAAAGLFDVLEHLEQPAELLDELCRVLRPGGRLYVTVPAVQGLWSVADDDARHWRRYTLNSLGSQLATSGLSLEYSSYCFAVLLPPVLLLRALPYRLGLYRHGSSLVPATIAREHDQTSPAARLLAPWLDREARWLPDHRLPAGASILAVARRET